MLKVAFLWHMHQPYYRDPVSGMMFLPWVRLHSLKDYCDLPARVGARDRLKMTFNLVPSLIEQIDLYCLRQTTDRHLDLTRKPAAQLTRSEKTEIFSTFFMVNPTTMIDPYPQFRRLYRKLKDCNMDAEMAARMSSPQEFRDLAVWSNLAWVDPLFRRREPFKRLFAQGEKFTEEDKAELIEAQYTIMNEIIPTYRSLLEAGKIEVSFTPYYHPILPLLCDTDSAREALPDITLPKNRFCYPEDAEKQVTLAIQMYREKFGRELTGMWPSEGSISEETAAILARQGIRWMASDEQVLAGSLVKAGFPHESASPYAVYSYNTRSGPLNVFFRDHGLSDRIGFVYSNWDPEKAADDFITHLHRLASGPLRSNADAVVPIILDGENCWEYYRNDGDDFLRLLFQRLESDPVIETVTMTEAAAGVTPRPLSAIMAGSWINHNFRVWIGHPEDNTAWDILWQARLVLTQFKLQHPDYDREKLSLAEKALLVAEGSDWNWWYGDEHRGQHNDAFDRIYRAHVASIYTCLGLDVPRELLAPIISRLPESYLTEPEGTVTPIIDGKLTHFYEWLGAGRFDCLKAGGTMHRAGRLLAAISYASDNDFIYVKVDFAEKSFLVDNPACRLKLQVLSPRQGVFLFGNGGAERFPDWVVDKGDILFGAGEIAEIGVRKSLFFAEGRGEILFRVGVTEEGRDIEIWPQVDPIRFSFSGRGEEMLWDL